MDETRVDGVQAEATEVAEAMSEVPHDEAAQTDDTLVDEVEADGAEDGPPDVEKLRRLRLRGFLRELVREEGRMEAAELLGVAYRTLVKAEESGEITGRVGDALERLLGTGDDPEVGRLRESVGALEERMAAMEGGLEELAKAVASGAGRPMGSENVNDNVRAQNPDAVEKDRAQGDDPENAAGEPGPTVTGESLPGRARPRRVDPEVVTEEPADDDPEVYGDAWSLVKEWRSLREDHPHRGRSLSWLTTEERLLVLELAMLEEHGLTLPPETQPLRGFARKGQTTHRWRALADTRAAMRRRKWLRVFTPWLWGR